MMLKEVYAEGTDRLRNAGIEEAEWDAWYLLEAVTGISRAVYFADSRKELHSEMERQYFTWIAQREKRIPLQHLTGAQEFMGMEFSVNEHVLIPRQDTEVLAETVLELFRDFEWIQKMTAKSGDGIQILDLCTGSGCILLSILKFLRKQNLKVSGTGIDLSEKALEIARKNGENLQVQAVFLQSDLFEKLDGTYAVIVSNPPYIRTAEIRKLQAEVREHDPILALDGGEDGLHFYRRIIGESGSHLSDGGYLLLEIGYDQAKDVAEMMQGAGFGQITIRQDLAGLDRVIFGVWQGEP